MDDGKRPRPGAAAGTVRCTACAHYFISHDVAFPDGCRALDFKSGRLPMLDVQASSGRACLYFQAKRGGATS